LNAQPDPEFHSTTKPTPKSKSPHRLPLKDMWTTNVITTLFCRFLLSLTVGTFQPLWFIFLSTPRWDPSTSPHTQQPPFLFTGGLGMSPSRVGTAMAILGSIGIVLQIGLYPTISAKLGTLLSLRLSLALLPLVCLIIPYLTLLPSASPPPAPMDGPIIWICLTALLSLLVFARTFALPANTILVNNCSPHPSVLGTIHGVAQSVGSGARFLGPVVGGTVFGAGEKIGVVGLAWWILAGIGVTTWVVSGVLKEGDGHEILLPGEKRVDNEVVYVEEEDDSEERRLRQG
jgi:hypothetical protein